MENVNKQTWHLAKDNKEIDVTDFELVLWRVFYGFLRWQEDCEAAVNKTSLAGSELSVLHVIRMKEKPKSIRDIARLLNREDNFNIHYSIKKLLKMGLIEKAPFLIKKSIAYQITEAGIKNTDLLAKARSNILINIFKREYQITLPTITQELVKIIAVYDEAGRITASYMEE